MNHLYNDQNQKTLRQKLRSNLGLPEVILWSELKSSKLGNKFRRQYGVGKYSLDFYCPEFRLGIELDGNTHDNEQSYAYDQDRTKFITEQNIRIVRIQNKLVMTDLNSVISEIKKYLI